MNRFLRIVFCLCVFAASCEAAEPEHWVFIDNGKIRLGVNRTAGASVGWFSESGREENLLNRYDLGRYLQQSWYGEEDGSLWNGKPWRWNPIQGGSWKGVPARVTQFSETESSIAATTIPRHWASGEEVGEVTLTEKITLEEHVAKIEFKMSYRGDKSHRIRDHELPAVFVNADYPHLHFIKPEETEPTSIKPGWPNERHPYQNEWVAYLNDDGHGIGIHVPGVDTLTCYRFSGDPNNRDKAACSYVAPIKRFPIEPGFEFEYTVYLTIGSLPQIRHRFAEIRKGAKE